MRELTEIRSGVQEKELESIKKLKLIDLKE